MFCNACCVVVRLSYAERNGGVGIAEIIVLFKAGIDLCSASCIISTAAGKRCLNAGQGLGIDGVHTGLCLPLWRCCR